MSKYGNERLWQKCIEVFGFPPTWDLSGAQASDLMTKLEERQNG